MKLSHLNLYARFFLIFTVTTILLVVFIVLGTFAISEKEAVEIIRERKSALHSMMINLVTDSIDIEVLTEEAKRNRVEIQITKGTEQWRTGNVLPMAEELYADAIRIGDLYFKKLDSKYFLSTDFAGYSITVTSKIANLIVYPVWIIWWPWLAVVLVLLASYGLLKSQLLAINRAIRSATEISQGNLKYRIDTHPNNDLGKLTRGLNSMAENLEQLFSAKTELLLSVSHELRSPMARMKVLLALSEKGEITAKLGHEINKMDTIVEQLLESERLKDVGKLLNIECYYLPNVMNDVLRNFEHVENLKVEGHLPEIVLRIDLGRFKFLLSNLIDNAVKHNATTAPVLFSCFEDNDYLKIQVRDFGCGIAAQDIDKIFEPFTQGGDIAHRSNHGVGLGLYLCRQIAQAHGGDISVQSEPGKGSEFTARFPIHSILDV